MVTQPYHHKFHTYLNGISSCINGIHMVNIYHKSVCSLGLDLCKLFFSDQSVIRSNYDHKGRTSIFRDLLDKAHNLLHDIFSRINAFRNRGLLHKLGHMSFFYFHMALQILSYHKNNFELALSSMDRKVPHDKVCHIHESNNSGAFRNC